MCRCTVMVFSVCVLLLVCICVDVCRCISASRAGNNRVRGMDSGQIAEQHRSRGGLSQGESSATQETKDCGPGWEFIHRACYRFVTDYPLSWDDALMDCQGQGGELFSVSDVGEKNKMRTKLRTLNRRQTWWVGLWKDLGGWAWLDGGDFDIRITRWWSGRGYREKCAEINANAQVLDTSCTQPRPFICERHEITPRPQDMTTEPVTTTIYTTASTTEATTTTTEPPSTTAMPTTIPSTISTSSTSISTIASTTAAATTNTSPSTSEEDTTPVEASASSSTTRPPTPGTGTPTSSSEPPPVQESTWERSSSREATVPTPTTLQSTDGAYTTVDEKNQARGNGDGHEQDDDDDDDDYDDDDDDDYDSMEDATTTTAQPVTDAATDGPEEQTTIITTPVPWPDTTDKDDREKEAEKDKKQDQKDENEEEEEEIDLFALYADCFLLKSRHEAGESQEAFLYTVGAQTCPKVTVLGTLWPETRHGATSSLPCKRSQGTMTFRCGGNPTCWRGTPDVDQCVSPRFKNILSKMVKKENKTEAPEPEMTMELTTELAEVTDSDDVTQEDIVATSKVITNLVTSGATQKVKDKKEVKDIVANVVKAGSNLVSANKTSQVWTNMAEHDKIRSATSLLVAMETATVAMAEELDEPTTIVTKDENIELELRVVNVSSSAMEESEEIVYQAEDSDNQFSIPVETLSHLSKGGLAKVVFMTHYTMGDILDDAADDDEPHSSESDSGVKAAEDESGDDSDKEKEQKTKKKEKAEAPKLASYILSASVGGNKEPVKLPQPISFTMKHIRNVPDGYHSLCSFWSISKSGMGAWSQAGCRVIDGNASQTTCECDHMTNFAVLMAPQTVELSDVHMSLLKLVTIVGCIISCMCLLASWITFTCFTTLQGERNSIHKNLVVCLFMAEMLFLTGIDQTQNRLACGIIAGFLHYFFLACFLWMLLEGVHIVLMLVQVFDSSRSRMPYYYASAYAPPVLVIAISAGLYPHGYGTDRYCWLTTDRYFIWSFVGPVAAILFANTVILIYAMTMVCRHSEYVFGGKDKSTASGIRSWIQGAMALEVLLGLTWILGFFFLDQQTVAVAYVFTALNSTQGLFIFIFHCLLNKKARKEYRRVIGVKRRPSTTGSGSGTQTSLAKKLTNGPSFSNKHSQYLDSRPALKSFNHRP